MYFSCRLNSANPLYYMNPEFMRRACCPVPIFHIFGELGGTANITVPGNCTVFPSILPDTVELMRSIQEERCTVLMGPPIIFQDLLRHPNKKDYDMSSLLLGIIAAAPVNPILIEELEREIPIRIMSQGFGQTENTGCMTMSVYAGDDKRRRYLSVGKAMPRIEMKIVDTENLII